MEGWARGGRGRGRGAQRPPSLPPSGSLSSLLLRRLGPHPPFPQPPLDPASELALAFPILGKQIQLATQFLLVGGVSRAPGWTRLGKSPHNNLMRQVRCYQRLLPFHRPGN